MNGNYIMLRLIHPTLMRRFCHTHSKTTFSENSNKVIEDLIRQQNETLKEIDTGINVLGRQQNERLKEIDTGISMLGIVLLGLTGAVCLKR